MCSRKDTTGEYNRASRNQHLYRLAGGDKDNQSRDIKTALRLARNLQEDIMAKTITTRYDVAEHLRTPEEMAEYLEACMEEGQGDAVFIARALGNIARAKRPSVHPPRN